MNIRGTRDYHSAKQTLLSFKLIRRLHTVELDYYWSRPPFTQHETLYKCPKRQALLRTFTQYDRFTFWDPFTDPEVPFDLEEECR